jgi:hypothetical protein
VKVLAIDIEAERDRLAVGSGHDELTNGGIADFRRARQAAPRNAGA